MATFKGKRKRGSWFVDVGGEVLPCTQERWFSTREGFYHDPFGQPGKPEWEVFVAALKENSRAVMTRGHGTEAEPTVYLGVYAIDQIEVTGSDLRFRVIKLLNRLM